MVHHLLLAVKHIGIGLVLGNSGHELVDGMPV